MKAETPVGTRWVGRRWRLSWNGYRGDLLRDAEATFRLPGRRRLKVTFKLNWTRPDADEVLAARFSPRTRP